MLVFSCISMPDHTGRRCDHAYGETTPAHDRIRGGVILLGAVQAHVSRSARLFN